MDTTEKQFCAWCGGTLERILIKGEYRLYCKQCGKISYENPITGVAGIILSPEQRILLGRRAKGEFGENQWCIPCGHVEYNEDIRQALVREMKEETGFLTEPVSVYDVNSNFHEPAVHTTGIWFLVRVLGGYCHSGDDIAELAFFGAANLPELAFETDRLVIRKLQRDRLVRE